MNQRLSDLANNLPKDGFHHTKNEFGPNNFELETKRVHTPMIIWMILINSKKKGYHH